MTAPNAYETDVFAKIDSECRTRWTEPQIAGIKSSSEPQRPCGLLTIAPNPVIGFTYKTNAVTPCTDTFEIIIAMENGDVDSYTYTIHVR